MNQGQKIIKYLAIAFAIFLIVNIISLTAFGLVSLSNIFSNNNSTSNIDGEVTNIKSYIKNMDIELLSARLIIEESNKFKIETNNEYITIRENNNKLSITEKKHGIFKYNKDTELIIYVPTKNTFNDINIETGAGKVNIDNITTDKLVLDLGAGEVNINNLNVLNNLDIDGGAGGIIIDNSSINNLDLDMGLGNLSITTKLTGNTYIDAGVGNIELNLIDSLDNYKIKLNKGIGSATLNKENIIDNIYYGNGQNLIEIDGGLGSINIKTNDLFF